ncbi:hypothetical protein Tco_1043288 [Tanacetum coccineum]|uniref:Uncharacterized protein n=1 Tax=Tanacetum coccineum TaxID=301880 RepID=A0ABQ5GM05_9ASTR
MAVLDSCLKHNMVAYLEKSEGNIEFHEIIDFLKRNSIHHALTDEGASSERPSKAQPTPSPAPTSKVPHEPQTDSSPAHTSFRSSERNTRLESSDHKAKKPMLNPESLSKGEIITQRDPQFDEIHEDTMIKRETMNAQKEGGTREMEYEDKEMMKNILSTDRWILRTDKEGVSTIMDKKNEGTEEKNEGTEEHIEGTEEKNEGTEEKNKGTEEHNEGTEEQVESTDGRNKREQFTIEERAKFLHDTIAAQRRFLAQQRSEAIRNRPPTKNQLRNQMMTYLKHVGNFKHAELKSRSFEKLQRSIPKGLTQGVAIAYTAWYGERKEYAGTLPLNQGHYRSDCPKLKNQNHGNQAEGTGASGVVHALRGGETNQDLNNMEDDIHV